MLATLLLGGLLLSPQKPLDFYARGPYSASVPRPESILGYGPGERQTLFRDQERVVLAIARAAPDRVKVVEYGKSAEGRPLRILVFSAPSNLSRLDAIQRDSQAVAAGSAPAAVVDRLPAIVWINQCIHGNEPASFESAMWLSYNLAASRRPDLVRILETSVVIVNPVYNPDGHERFAVWSNSVAVGSGRREAFEQREPSIIHGRTNHYRFDMNRDRISLTQDETRAEVAEEQRWWPHVYVDQHGQVSSYFMPPNPMSINANVDRARLNHWTEYLGRATAKAFDEHGWQYFIKDTYDFFSPCYTDTWAGLGGAIGMTHETDGGKQLAKERSDGTVISLRDGIEKHFTSALAVMGAAVARRQDLVRSYADFRRKAAAGQMAGKFQRVVLQGEPRQLARLKAQLDRHGIRSSFATERFRQADAHDYWADTFGAREFSPGALIVDMAQPQGQLAKSLLEPTVDFEPEFTKRQLENREKALREERYPGADGPEFYDFTGWSLPYAHNLKAWWCESAPNVRTAAALPVSGSQVAESSIGWAIPYTDDADALAVFDLLRQGVRVRVAPKPMKLADRGHGSGTFLVLRSRNDDDVREKLSRVVEKRGIETIRLTTGYPESDRYGLGSDVVGSLKKPEIAVVFGDATSTTYYGPIWWLMEREWGLPFTPISASALGSADIAKYSCIVVPAGHSGAVPDRLRTWISDGGCLVALSGDWANTNFAKLEAIKAEGGKEPGSLPGGLFRAELDTRSFLSYGYGGDGEGKKMIAVPVEGGGFVKAKAEGGGAVVFSADAKVKKQLSGWVWPDTEKSLGGAAWLHDQPVGRGRVIIFFGDPSERAMWPGMYRMLLNAMLLGPAG